jgi:hypothetical protein
MRLFELAVAVAALFSRGQFNSDSSMGLFLPREGHVDDKEQQAPMLRSRSSRYQSPAAVSATSGINTQQRQDGRL